MLHREGRDVRQMARFTEVFTQAARDIHAAMGLEESLEAIVRSAATSLPDIDFVGISVGYPDGRLETLAASDDAVLTFDKMQYDAGSGPCIYAMEAEAVMRVEHAAEETRWPDFMPTAVAAGLRSMLGVRLLVDDERMAALNMYSVSSATLDDDLESLAELFASYAALTLGFVRREDQLTRALESRRLIGQAIGIVMERYSVDEKRAFRYLTRVSNDSNVKLRDLAAEIVGETNEKNGNDPA